MTRDALLNTEPAVVEKFLRATIKGIIYYSTNRSGAVQILARNVKTQESLAAKIYDLVKPALTPESILNDDLQKRVMAPLLERSIGATGYVGRFFDFALARKINSEIKGRGVEAVSAKVQIVQNVSSHGRFKISSGSRKEYARMKYSLQRNRR